jgi:hypothetical protein
MTLTALALVASYAAAAVAFCALPARRVIRAGAFVAALAVILPTPLLVPLASPVLRFAAALSAIALAAKLYDLHANPGRASRFTFPSYLAYLVNWTNLVPRMNPPCPTADRRRDVRRLVGGVVLVAAGAALLALAFDVRWSSAPFLLEHGAKVAVVYLTVAGLGTAGAAAYRLAGLGVREPMAHPELAPTPAEFWRRWNRPAQQLFYEDVFKPLGGLRAPVWGTLATFAASAAVHEYVFGVAAGGAALGYRTAFFLVQGCAAAATLRVRLVGARRVAGVVLTVAFVLGSSVLFFRSVDAIVPWYDR